MQIKTKFGTFDIGDGSERDQKLTLLFAAGYISEEELRNYSSDAKIVYSQLVFPHDDLGNPVE